MAGLLEREAPRISINKLGEYMTATPGRRRGIVRDQRRPKGFLVPRYNEAQNAIIRSLTAEDRDPGALLDEIQRLRSKPAASAWEEQRNASCAEALAAFLEIWDEVPTNARYERAPQQPPVLRYGDVAVSVRPELISHGVTRRETWVGALKLYFSKTNPLTPDAGAFIATGLADFAEQYLALSGKALPSRCLVIDVFARRIFTPPRSRRRRQAELLAACEEIARAWPAAGETDTAHHLN